MTTGPSRSGRSAATPESRPDALVVAELREILAEITGTDELLHVPASIELFGGGVGLDSLTGTLLLRRVQRQYGVDVAAEDLNLDALQTLGTLAAFIAVRL